MISVKITVCLTFFIVPALTYIIGLRVKKNPPRQINKTVGYRTALSMSSQEAWDYANGRMGELMIKGALYSFVVAVIGAIITLVINVPTESIVFPIIISAIILIQVVCMMTSTFTIEKELRNEVYKNN